jgi:hypothetical protein
MKDWISVLGICKKYGLRQGVEECLEQLRNPPRDIHYQLCPASKLCLAWEFGIEEWYEECIREVLPLPLPEAGSDAELGNEDMEDLGGTICAVIFDVEMRYYEHRMRLVSYEPEAVHSSHCDPGLHPQCAAAWQFAYTSCATLFQPNRSPKGCARGPQTVYTGRDVFGHLSKANVPNLNLRCQRLSLKSLGESGVLWEEEGIVEYGWRAIRHVLLTSRPEGGLPPMRYISELYDTNGYT